MKPTARFGPRAAAYERGRPQYATAALDWIRALGSLSAEHRVCDMGAGTGKLTRQLAAHHRQLVAIEPNRAMLRELKATLPNIWLVQATAERTGLADSCIDAVFVGQAFHWMDVDACHREWRRILRGPRMVALLWNDRRLDSDFMVALEELISRHATLELERIPLRGVTRDELCSGFSRDAGSTFRVETFSHEHLLDQPGLIAWLHSVSYLPGSASPKHAKLLEAASRLFEQHAIGGSVSMQLETVAYVLAIR